MAVDAALATRLLGMIDADLLPDARLGRVRRYLAGNHDLPYMPRGAKGEFEQLARRSITNWTPLIPDTFSKGLFVDGYRPAKSAENSAPWRFWQENGLDARQTIAHRGALEYGTSYVLVLPGTLKTRRVPVMRPLSPLRSLAWYADPDDEYPEVGVLDKGTSIDGTRLFEVYDSMNVYTCAQYAERGSELATVVSKVDEHGMGVTPFQRFRDRLDGESVGLVAPILTLQDRVNEVVFATMIALQYASFRQRWATGLAIPVDDETGEPLEPFEAAVNRLWVSDSPDARFGDFAQTEISGHLNLYDSTVRTTAAISQISPNILTGDLVNLSAEALGALNDTTQRKRGEFETLFGEAWEGGFRLAALAAGDREAALDTSAQVRWRDTEARSLADTVDALGKVAQLLQVPVEALWEKIPGVTETDVAYWRSLRDEGDVLGQVVQEFQRQTGAVDQAPTATTVTTV